MIGESVTRQRGTPGEDRNGNSIIDWDTPAEVTIGGCALAPNQAGEDHGDGRHGVVIGWTLYAPAGADITALDRIVARGDTYEIDGHPADWVNGHTGANPGLEVPLRRVEG